MAISKTPKPKSTKRLPGGGSGGNGFAGGGSSSLRSGVGARATGEAMLSGGGSGSRGTVEGRSKSKPSIKPAVAKGRAARAANSKMVASVARGGSIKKDVSNAQAVKSAKDTIKQLHAKNQDIWSNRANWDGFSFKSPKIRETFSQNEKKIAQLQKMIKKWQ